jgi:hypothetical protein
MQALTGRSSGGCINEYQSKIVLVTADKVGLVMISGCTKAQSPPDKTTIPDKGSPSLPVDFFDAKEECRVPFVSCR